MDDDLRPIATLLAKPEPPREVELCSRNRLLARMGARPRRRFGWLVPGFGMVAAAVLALVVGVTMVGTTSAPGSGREVLLVAATSAERSPEDPGRYWYTRAEADHSELVMENWVSRDGRRWSRGTPANPDKVGPGHPRPFVMGDVELTWDELQALPADPERLTAWIRDTHEPEDHPAAVEELEDLGVTAADEERSDVVHGLAALITSMPAPSDVRAAAFRALADLPGVESRGAVEGGEALSIPTSWGSEIKLVVDPETSRVSRANVVVGNDGSVLGGRTGYRLTSEWTNQLSR
ncbi:hypothetical protein E1292_11115 [Nonomuraea deserti]|uniref:CU044_5270 family protein n=1 Tax=Nonomuraea deserti TaxID=1848322 RepID=A0A4R4VTR3_9ACTN|nr:CU044_5270 family protein [Nonomuraea deserti]TDD08681.1 hypothetical protein E1292_11115 [Nonomuraea deserti]